MARFMAKMQAKLSKRKLNRIMKIKNKRPKKVDTDKQIKEDGQITKSSIIASNHSYKSDVMKKVEALIKAKDEEKLKKRAEIVEERKKWKEEELKHTKQEGLGGLIKEVQQKQTKYIPPSVEPTVLEVQKNKDASVKAYSKEYRKVIDASDVILEVLDARDPLGTRSQVVEQSIMESGGKKRLVLVLNKADLVPPENLQNWLKYLRRSFPTVSFKASTQKQRNKLGRKKNVHPKRSNKMSSCIGADVLMSSLANYCRNKGIKTSITVGIVGMPNVGKSSIINSLMRHKACQIGAVPGVTKRMQEVQLDSKIKLLDSPGVVFNTSGHSKESIALKNASSISTIADPIVPATAILQRTNKEQLEQLYGVIEYSSPIEFLSRLAKAKGMIKKGGVPNVESAAIQLINDWNSGRILYYTLVPEDSMETHISAEIVQEMANEFDVNSFEPMEMESLKQLRETKKNADPSQPGDITEQTDDVLSNQIALAGVKKKKRRRTGNKKEKSDSMMELEGNLRLNRMNKLAFKKMKKDRARIERRLEAAKLNDDVQME